MWFRKQKPELLECVGCGCLMSRVAKEIEVEEEGVSGDTSGTFYIYTSPFRSTESYCGRCAPAYDKRYVSGSTTRYYRKEPAQNVEITEKGKAIS